MSTYVEHNPDTSQFEYLYERTYRLVYTIIKTYVNDDQSIQDLVQDTFFSAYQNFDSLNGYNLESFRPWICKIASNKAKDYAKKQKLLMFSDIRFSPTAIIDVIDTNHEHSPEIYAHKTERSKLLHHTLALLPQNQRQCIVMYYLEERSTQEIAETLGICESSVRSRIQYGREKIRKILQHDIGMV